MLHSFHPVFYTFYRFILPITFFIVLFSPLGTIPEIVYFTISFLQVLWKY